MSHDGKLEATKPLGIIEKFRESRFYLARMADHELSADVQNFLLSLSAFLSAFGAIRNRLLGVEEAVHNEAAKRGLDRKLKAHPRIGFLLRLRNAEVHGDGVTVWPLFRFSHFSVNSPGALERHFIPGVPSGVRVVGTRFEGGPPGHNSIELCHDALDDFEEIFRQTRSCEAMRAASLHVS
jgi:hypothetical protein